MCPQGLSPEDLKGPCEKPVLQTGIKTTLPSPFHSKGLGVQEVWGWRSLI